LGAAAFLLPYQASAAPKALVGWSKMSTALVSVGAGLAVIGATYFATQSSVEPAPVAPVKPPAVAPMKPRPVATPTESTDRADAELGPRSPEPSVSPSRKLPVPDPLVEEIAILSKATSALRAGNPSEGLRLLNEHQRKFPSGRLAEERRAARIQALCALGRRTEAEAELARLAHSSPRSPHLARAQRACGFTP
jgi:hypothetical protein